MKEVEIFKNMAYFSDEDHKSFEKFLNSPFYNSLNSSVVVYKIIKVNLSLIKENKHSELKKIISAKTGYSKIYLRKVLANLNNSYIEYLKYTAFNSEKFYKEYHSCLYLLKKGNYNVSQKIIMQADYALLTDENTDLEVFLKTHELNSLKYSAVSTSPSKYNPLSKIQKQKEYTIESARNLFVYAVTRTTVDFINYTIQCDNKESEKFPVNLFQMYTIVEMPEFKSYSDFQQSAIMLYFYAFKLFQNPERDSNYKQFKTYYYQVRHLFGKDFCKTIESILLNFCYFRSRIKDIDRYYLMEGLNLLYNYIENEYYITPSTNYLNSVQYRNFVINCMSAGKEELLKSFIENHSNKLNPEDSSLMKKFGLAHLHYIEGNYKKAILKARSLFNLRDYFKIDISLLLIKSYFEINNFEKVEGVLKYYYEIIKEAAYFTKFDREIHMYFYVRMTDFIREMDKYALNNNISGFETLLKKIISRDSFAMKNWLKEKVTEILSAHYKSHNIKTAKSGTAN